MACVPTPDWVVGPTASVYTLPLVSVTDCTAAVESFHPTTTTLRSPAVWAAGYGTVTTVGRLCGAAAFAWTNVTRAVASCEKTIHVNVWLFDRLPSMTMAVTV